MNKLVPCSGLWHAEFPWTDPYWTENRSRFIFRTEAGWGACVWVESGPLTIRDRLWLCYFSLKILIFPTNDVSRPPSSKYSHVFYINLYWAMDKSDVPFGVYSLCSSAVLKKTLHVCRAGSFTTLGRVGLVQIWWEWRYSPVSGWRSYPYSSCPNKCWHIEHNYILVFPIAIHMLSTQLLDTFQILHSLSVHRDLWKTFSQ